jgi:hypothetical protein
MCCGKATDASFLVLNIICDAKWPAGKLDIYNEDDTWTLHHPVLSCLPAVLSSTPAKSKPDVLLRERRFQQGGRGISDISTV